MRSSFATHRGLALTKTPSAREQAGRRRLLVACAMVGLALASGVIGALAHAPADASGKTSTGPFSYFPTE
jgi:nitrous oxide reductase